MQFRITYRRFWQWFKGKIIMLTFKNITTGKEVKANGCWLDPDTGGVSFVAPACHGLLDMDSPIAFDLNAITVEDDFGDVYEVYPFPDGWVIVGT
jgi:hypothetical protein